jgi:peptidoglycan DL-endopeptidase CwlO
MQQPRGLLRHAVAAGVAAAAVIGVGAGPAAAKTTSRFSQSDIAPAARATRDGLLALRSRPSAEAGNGYLRARSALAGMVATAGGGETATIDRDWEAVSDERLLAVYAALEQVGKPYRYAVSDPDVGFDCSGLTAYAWGTVGVGLAHSSRNQIQSAEPVAAGDVQPGDLVYYPGHVSLAVDDGIVVHAPHPGSPVQVRAMWSKHSVRAGDPTD